MADEMMALRGICSVAVAAAARIKQRISAWNAQWRKVSVADVCAFCI